MTISEVNVNIPTLLIQLGQIATSDFVDAAETAARVIDYTKRYEAGALSKEEYKDLLLDLGVEAIVATAATDMEVKEALAAIVTSLLGLVGNIAIPVTTFTNL
jgi:hypothetical protein